jgi:TPR repeat protein
LYEKGLGGPRDPKKAIRLFKQAADAGVQQAESKLRATSTN